MGSNNGQLVTAQVLSYFIRVWLRGSWVWATKMQLDTVKVDESYLRHVWPFMSRLLDWRNQVVGVYPRYPKFKKEKKKYMMDKNDMYVH